MPEKTIFMVMIYETIGWTGAFLFILAYYLLSMQKLNADGVPYQLMNVIAAICLIVNAVHLQDYPNFVTNFVWMGIGMFSLYQIYKRLKTKG
ncbi:MAG: hypothetical protein RIG77_07205 [Cyclobacteriaceae bacterium]